MKKRLEASLVEQGSKVQLRGVDDTLKPFHLYKQIDVTGLAAKRTFPSRQQTQQPYRVTLPAEAERPANLSVELQFMGHYYEKNIKFDINLA